MRDFSKTKRIVVKIGTNILTKKGGVDAGYVRRIAGQVNSLLKGGKQFFLFWNKKDAHGTLTARLRPDCRWLHRQPYKKINTQKSFTTPFFTD